MSRCKGLLLFSSGFQHCWRDGRRRLVEVPPSLVLRPATTTTLCFSTVASRFVPSSERASKTTTTKTTKRRFGSGGSHSGGGRENRGTMWAVGAASVGGVAAALSANGPLARNGVASAESAESAAPPRDVDDMPEYTSEFVAKNNGENGKPVWMSYGGVVYDVTDFVNNHPGGSERILTAAGKAVEPYWYLYRQHFASDLPMSLLERFAIGRLREEDQDRIDAEMEELAEREEDPYAHEPRRDPSLRVHSEQPMNAESPAASLTEHYLTPTERFYIRHHHPVPLLTAKELEDFRLEIDVSGFVDDDQEKIIRLSMDELRALPKVEVVATLQCSGNRRGDMNDFRRTSGTAWGQGAVSTARWGGVRLTDLLKIAGVKDPHGLPDFFSDQETHVRSESLDGMRASIHTRKAADPCGDVVVAYEMNGAPLPRDHGFPLRLVVPGYAAVRSVKWLSRLELSTEEAEGAWQRGLNYKTLPPSVTNAKTVNMDEMPGMTEVSVFSGITNVEVDKKQEEGESDDPNNPNREVKANVSGWAWAGGGRNVVRVDVTGDNGRTWTTSTIGEGKQQRFGRAWAWVFWEARGVPCIVDGNGDVSLASKAVDLAFNAQPEDARHGWNVRGLGTNAWYRCTKKVA